MAGDFILRRQKRSFKKVGLVKQKYRGGSVFIFEQPEPGAAPGYYLSCIGPGCGRRWLVEE